MKSKHELLPEHLGYRDDGCDLFASCLNCPLPRCRYDEPGRRQTAKDLRNKEIVHLHQKEGLKVEKLAQRFGVSKRTVYRIIGRNHDE